VSSRCLQLLRSIRLVRRYGKRQKFAGQWSPLRDDVCVSMKVAFVSLYSTLFINRLAPKRLRSPVLISGAEPFIFSCFSLCQGVSIGYDKTYSQRASKKFACSRIAFLMPSGSKTVTRNWRFVDNLNKGLLNCIAT